MTDAYQYADLEIRLQRRDDASFLVALSLRLPDSDARSGMPAVPLHLDRPALDAVAGDPDRYGETLTGQLFAAEEVRDSFTGARGAAAAQGVPLRVRLQIEPQAGDLHELRWETLRDPQKPDALLATDETVLFSRYLSSSDWRPVRLLPRAGLRALVVVANPDDLDVWNLAPVDVVGELQHARQGLGDLPIDALCRCHDPRCADLDVGIVGRPTLNELLDRLRQGYDILYLVAHGALVQRVPRVWLEEPEGIGHLVEPAGPGGLVTLIGQLPQLPRLVVLASCQSAGDGTSTDGGALAALGPRLAEAGVPAVVAMQGNVTVATVSRFMPRFFEGLQEGQIEDAMAVARRTVHTEGRPDWWMPVLFSRLESGRLFAAEAAEGAAAAGPPLFTVPFPRNPDFVGRDEDLARLHEMVQQGTSPVGLRPTVLVGLGGIGKTQLAVEYAHRHRTDYRSGIFWLNAVNPLLMEFAALAETLGLANPETPRDQAARAVWSYLDARPDALAIFDNVEEPSRLNTPVVPSLIPANLRCRTLPRV